MQAQDKEDRELPDYLATPFPHTQPWNPPINYVREPDRPTPVDALTDHEYGDPRWTSGSLTIAEFGCGAFHRLVITGQARGQVWFDDRAADNGLTPEAADFHSWYQDWLDRLSP